MEQNEFFQRIIDDDEISWKSMIMESVRNNEMDPWDIDISAIATQFMEMLKSLEETNFKISGKVVLTSALLLKLKSRRFIDEDISALDSLISTAEAEDEYLDDDFEGDYPDEQSARVQIGDEEITINKRTPLARKRKVSVYDLIEALEQALEVNKRRTIRQSINAPDVQIPTQKFDISDSMDVLYREVLSYFQQKQDLTFSQLIPSDERQDKIYTFIPLLYLRNARKVDLTQNEHFADFAITQYDAQKELAEELQEK